MDRAWRLLVCVTVLAGCDDERTTAQLDGATSDGDPASCPIVTGPAFACGTPCVLATAAPGAIVDLPGFDPLAAPPPPMIRSERERVLLFSDSPEEPAQPGLLARANLPAGPVRLYLYHLNASSTPKKFVVVLQNNGAAAVRVDLERFEVAAPSANFLAVGKTTTHNFLAANNASVKAVPAGGVAHLLTTLDTTPLAPGDLGHAIIDARLDGPLTAHVIFADVADDVLASLGTYAPLTRDANHQRGTFTGADRDLALGPGCTLPGGGAGSLRVRLGHDTELAPRPAGVDEITGDAQDLVGHYGYVYRIASPISTDAGTYAVVLMARGGAYAGSVMVRGGELGEAQVDLPAGTLAIDDPSRAILIDRVSAGSPWSLTWTAPGASNLPADVIWLPLGS